MTKNNFALCLDKSNILKGIVAIRSIERNYSDDYKVFVLCEDELSRLILNKLKFDNVIAVPLHTLEENDSALRALRDEAESSLYSESLKFTFLLYLMSEYSNIDGLILLDPATFSFRKSAGFDYLSIKSPVYTPYSKLSYSDKCNHEFNFAILKNQAPALRLLKSIRDLYFKYYDDVELFRTNYKALIKNSVENAIIETNASVQCEYLSSENLANNYDELIENLLNSTKISDYFLGFCSLSFINPYIIIPELNSNIKLSYDIIERVYMPYILELYSAMSSIRSYFPEFTDGLNSADALTMSHCFIAHRAVWDDLEVKGAPHKTYSLGEQLKLYIGEQLNQTPAGAHNSSQIKQSKVDYQTKYKIAVDLAANGEIAILEAIKQKPLAKEIKTLYFIGAHKFQERYEIDFVFPNLENIILFEPIKELYDYIKPLEAEDSRLKIFNYAIFDTEGAAEFNISDNEGASSSLLDFGEHKKIFPDVSFSNKILVQTRRIDSLIREFDLPAPDALMIDAQGAEYQIISSINRELFSDIKLVYLEASVTEVYKEQKLLSDLIDILSPEMEFIVYAPLAEFCAEHGNALFINQKYLSEFPLKMDSKYKIAALVSAYNSEFFIEGCLEDLCAQTLFRKNMMEIIVVDSASEQNEGEIVKHWQKKFGAERIKYYRCDERVTLYKAWNIALNMAESEYATSANCDDRHRPDALELMANYLDNNHDCVLTYADQLISDKANARFEDVKCETRWGWDDWDYSTLEKRCIVGPQPLWRINLHDKYGYFREDYKSAGDYEFWLRIGKNEKFYRYPDILGVYYYNPNSLERIGGDGYRETRQIWEDYGITRRGIIAESTIPKSISIAELNSLPYRNPINISVSVIMPTAGDREMFIKRAITSVLNQRFKDFELIIINDGGEDISGIIAEYDDDRIKLIEFPMNLGKSNARNAGLEAALGKYIAYLDDDDYYLDNHLQTLVDYLENNLDTQIAYTDSNRVSEKYENGRYVQISKELVYSEDFDYDKILVGNFIPILNIMHLRKCYAELGGFDTELDTHEDWELWLRYSRSYKFAHIPTVSAEFSWRQDGSSETSRNRRDFIESKKYVFAKYAVEVSNKPRLKSLQEMDIKYLENELQNRASQSNQTEKVLEIEPVEIDSSILASIVIPVHNNYEFTKTCIDSIFEIGSKYKFEVIVIDNASDELTANYLRELASANKIILIRNDDNLAYSIVNNQGAFLAKGEYLVFLNNDTNVTSKWLDNIIDQFEFNSEIGVQGAKLIYGSGIIQHAGVVYGKYIRNVITHYHIYINCFADCERVNKSREYQMVTGALLCVRKSIFDRIGGFDERYYFGHEDLDLCMNVRLLGYKVWYNADSVVYHYESRTKMDKGIENFQPCYIKADSTDAKNNALFLSKWKDKLVIDDQKYYIEDGMYGLCADESLRSKFLDKAELVLKELSRLTELKDTNNLAKLLKILFQHPIDYKRLTELDVFNINYNSLEIALALIGNDYAELIAVDDKDAELPANAPSVEANNNSNTFRIMFVMYGWNETGGGTTFPKALAKELVKSGYDVSVFYADLTRDVNSPAYSVKRWQDDGVKLFGVYNRPSVFTDENNPAREINDENINMRFREAILEFQPEIIHFHNFHGMSMSMADVAKSMNIPSCFTPHNYYLIDPQLYLFREDLSLWDGVDLIKNSSAVANNPHLLGDYKRRVDKAKELINSTIDITLAVSSRQKELFVEFGGLEQKIAVVNQANIISDKLQCSSKLKKASERDIKFPIKFGFIGGVMPQKGVHLITKAAQYFDKNYAEFHIYGFVSERYKNMLDTIDVNKRLIWHGEYKYEDLENIGAEIDVIITPSVWEDCAPLVVMESTSMRVPTIGARIGGITDFIIENENGFLYAYNSIDDLVSKIDYCIRNPKQIQDMRKTMPIRHSFSAYYEHLQKIYQQLRENKMQDPFSFELKYENGEERDDLSKRYENVKEETPTAGFKANIIKSESMLPEINGESDEEFIKSYLQNADFEVLDFHIDDDSAKPYFDLKLAVRIKKEKGQENTIQKTLNATHEITVCSHSKIENTPVFPETAYSPSINIVWEGTQFVYHSLALINREICDRLIEANVAELTIVPYEDDKFYDGDNPKYKRLASKDIRYKDDSTPRHIKELPYAWVRHQWPPKAVPPAGAKWIIMQPWEMTSLLKEHVEIFKQAAEIWTPSNYSRKAFIDSGIDFDKVQVIPNGIDPNLFTPLGEKLPIPSLKRFKFLFVGGTIYRKGYDILLEAFSSVFTAEDDVCLVIKDIGGDSFYKGQTAESKIKELQAKPNAPEIHYIDSKLTEEEMAELYRACDVFVSSYRGEGFSMPTLEAMACGVPVMVTQGGSTDDFVDEEVGWMIPATFRPLGDTLDDKELTHTAHLLEPDLEELKKMLKYVVAEPSGVFFKGVKAAYRARKYWTWNNSAMKVLSRLDCLYGTDMAKKASSILVNQEDSLLIFSQACIEFEKRNFEYAFELWNRVILSEDLPARYKTHIYHSIALRNLEEGKLEDADKFLEIAVRELIEHPDNNYLRAIYYAKTEKFSDAYDTIKKLYDNWTYKKYESSIGVALDTILNLHGEVCYMEGDIEAALTLFKETLKFNPDNYDACYGSALCLIELGAVNDAKGMLEWAVKLKPDFEEAIEELRKIR
jgi:FkbM family methyltransferase